MRHTTFRSHLDPTVEQLASLWRHAGASRFTYNQCLTWSLGDRGRSSRRPQHRVPWSGFDLINAFYAWKKSDDAGRVFAADSIDQVVIQTTGLAWRDEVCQHVFEETAWIAALWLLDNSLFRQTTGQRSGFPRFKSRGARCHRFECATGIEQTTSH